MGSTLEKVLLIRIDRIGDLVLSLPVEDGLRRFDPGAKFSWWITKGLGFVAEASQPERQFREVNSAFSWSQFISLWKELRRDRPKIAIVLHAPWWVSLVLFFSRIPFRIGPRSQWHQILFLNQSIRQKRSDARFHELEYNYRLVEDAFLIKAGTIPRTHLVLKSRHDETLAKLGLLRKNYIVVHPGMGGSALNWPSPHYAQLIARLAQETTVIVTGTSADEKYLSPIRKTLHEQPRIQWLNGKLSGEELICVLENARSVIAPSTGVLHLAASTGTPTIGLFSPVRVQSSVRWGPQGEKVVALSPDVQCPGEKSCLGPKCIHFDCMQRVSVSSVEDSIRQLSE